MGCSRTSHTETPRCLASPCIHAVLAMYILPDAALPPPLQVGTIFGVWPGDKLKGITGRDQAAAGMGVFGPRTCFVIALKDAPGCHEFLLQDDGARAQDTSPAEQSTPGATCPQTLHRAPCWCRSQPRHAAWRWASSQELVGQGLLQGHVQ